MICLIIGYGARALPLLQEILREEGINGIVLTDQNCEKELDKVERAEVIFIYAHELP